MNTLFSAVGAASFLILSQTCVQAQEPAAIAAPGERLVMTVQAAGAQIYECKSDAAGKLSWQFREPIASLMIDGKTVGRHFEGPSWQIAQGPVVTARAAGRAPGATDRDIPLLRLSVVTPHKSGEFSGVTTIQRLNTVGGVLEGTCPSGGLLTSVPYSADYRFLQKPD